jgi:hypothetical protein
MFHLKIKHLMFYLNFFFFFLYPVLTFFYMFYRTFFYIFLYVVLNFVLYIYIYILS